MLYTRVIANTYYDSLTLMRLSSTLSAFAGVEQAAVMMATDVNKEFLKDAALLSDEVARAGASDVCVCIRIGDQGNIDAVQQAVEDFFAGKTRERPTERKPKTLSGALKMMPEANLAIISVPGVYAANEARKAMQAGLNVFLFSDNVTIEEEVELKEFASRQGLICMGPDCGTAIINGVGLGFANAVRRGNIGIVAASGTGSQEVSTLAHKYGAGISQLIGTGGRDLKQPVKAVSTLTGLDALAADAATEVIVLISKPPDAEIANRVLRRLAAAGKPSVVVFLGAEQPQDLADNIYWAADLEQGAKYAVALAQGDRPSAAAAGGFTDRAEQGINHAISQLAKEQKYVRALYSGGTLCDEAIFALQPLLGEIWSGDNVGNRSKTLPDPLSSQGHCLIDMGDDFFTRGRPHPMIDYTSRCARIVQEARDAETAVLLLDIVLGYGSHRDPQAELLPAISQAQAIAAEGGRCLPVVASICGTDQDIQGYKEQCEALEGAGVLLFPSNAAASKAAAMIACRQEL